VKNAYRLGEKRNMAHRQGAAQTRLRALEGEPFIEQVDTCTALRFVRRKCTVAPLFEVFAVP
jgi:hypothetical protein